MQDDALLGSTGPKSCGEGAPIAAWQPIETAPTNHRAAVLVALENGGVGEAERHGGDDSWWWANTMHHPGAGPIQFQVTHWMPLPTPPKLEHVRSSSGAPNPDDATTRRANTKDTVDTIQKGG